MEAVLATGGERLRIRCQIPWVTRLIEETADEQLQPEAADLSWTVSVRVEADRRPFDLRGWEPVGLVASAFAARLPAFEIVLPGRVGSRLTDTLQPLEATG